MKIKEIKIRKDVMKIIILWGSILTSLWAGHSSVPTLEFSDGVDTEACECIGNGLSFKLISRDVGRSGVGGNVEQMAVCSWMRWSSLVTTFFRRCPNRCRQII